ALAKLDSRYSARKQRTASKLRDAMTSWKRKRAYSIPSGFLNLISFLPMPCASYQCNSASQTVPSKRRTVAIPLSLRHFPRPYSRFKRRRSRTVVPDAIDSTLRISERSSNLTTKSLTQQPSRDARRDAHRFRHGLGSSPQMSEEDK